MSEDQFLNGRVRLLAGDCLQRLGDLASESIDSCVTDPPYHFTSIVKRFGADNAAPAKEGKTGAYKRASAGFMGKQWDGGDVAFQVKTWLAVWRVLKPGAHLIAFSGTRTYHRMACAIDDAGFEVRDQLAWLYGNGFPKSHNQKGEWEGWGTALKPAWEPCVLARKPLSEGAIAANVLRWGTGALNIDGCRVETMEEWSGRELPDAKDGVCWGGTLNASSSSSSHPLGRWPANIIHDGSDKVVVAFPDTQSGYSDGTFAETYGDSGCAARFFYTAKADSDDRLGSKHPTVKPLDLMQYLVRLVTPPGGTVLDLFAGTGTTGEAAWREGFNAILIEREAEYQEDIRRRMRLCLAGPNERQREAIKARGLTVDAGPLFGGDEKARGGQGVFGVFADEQSARQD